MKRLTITRRHVVVAMTVLWMLTFVHTVRAATLNEFMGGYDENLLKWAAIICLLGGSIRTIFSLESDKRAIRDIAATAAWDLAKSLVAGMLAFFAIQFIRSLGIMIPNEVRFTAVLVAGWARMAAFDWIMNAGKEKLEALKVQVVAKPLDEKKDKL